MHTRNANCPLRTSKLGTDYIFVNYQKIKLVPAKQGSAPVLLVADHRFEGAFEDSQQEEGPSLYVMRMYDDQTPQPRVFEMGLLEKIREHAKLPECMLGIGIVTTQYDGYVTMVTMCTSNGLQVDEQDLCEDNTVLTEDMCEEFEKWVQEVCEDKNQIASETPGDFCEAVEVNHIMVIRDNKYDEEKMTYNDCFAKPYK